jgi:hypothetical protein
MRGRCLQSPGENLVPKRHDFSESIFNPFLEPGPGLPDGFFSDHKSQFGLFCWTLEWKMLLYILAISNILLSLVIFLEFGNFVIF